jgi:hypothetical protein
MYPLSMALSFEQYINIDSTSNRKPFSIELPLVFFNHANCVKLMNP